MHAYMRVVLVVALVWPGGGYARTWHVEKDGSGDYVEIQDAVNAAAVGDTVLIGIGRYDTLHHVVESGAPEDYAVVHVLTDSLTLRGVDRDLVIIGPETPPEKTIQRQGIEVLGMSWIDIENLTVENMQYGIQVGYSGRIAGCTVRSSKNVGIWATEAHRIAVENCEFYDCDNGVNVFVFGSGHEWAYVENCKFWGGAVGVDSNHPQTTIAECQFNNPTGAGVQFSFGGSGVVRNCRMDGGNYGVIVTDNSTMELMDCDIRNSIWSAVQVTFSTLRGSGNILHGGAHYTLGVSSARLDFHGNHIMPGTEYSVKMHGYNIPDAGVDLTGNFWGTTDSAEIAAWIWDGNDDPIFQAVVQYEPFSAVPLPSESKTMSDIKNMFR
jgi:Right handed beta helix region